MKVRAALGAVVAGVLVAAGAHAETVNAPAVAGAYAVRLNPPRSPMIGGCGVFPSDNSWNRDLHDAPVRAGSAQTIAFIQANGGQNLHADFGENQTYGMPFVVVPQDQALVPITYDAYGNESDPGPFPIPLNAPVENGSDRHVLVLRQGTCDLFELYDARRTANGWMAQSGARYDLTSNALRHLGWTSADAAGLPITPGLVRYEEVASGHIDHALRVTLATTQHGYILPATHFASSITDPAAAPMGLRLRLRADYDISHFTGQALVIAQAMKTYGLIVADNGSNWFFQGAPSPWWNDADLNQLKAVPGTAFEAVDTGPVVTG